MRIKFFLLFLVACTTQVWATAKQETATIVIVNPDEISLSVQAEITPSVVFKYYSTQKKRDTLHIESTSTFRLVFGNLNADKKVYTTFLIQNGEKVVIAWQPDSITVISENKARGNELKFFVEMQKEIGSFEGLLNIIPHKRKNADSLLYKVKELYTKRLGFLETYKASHPISVAYESEIRKVLLYRHYYEFLDHCKMDNILDKNLLTNSNVQEFLDPLWGFHDSSIYLLEALALAENLHRPDEKNFLSLYTAIQSKYEGEQQDYLLFKVLNMAYNSRELGELTDHYLSTARSEALKKYVTNEYADFGGTGLEIIKPAYDYSKESLLYHLKTGKFISWDNLVHQHGAKYIDFWATWCGGCRVNLPHTRKIAEEYSSKGVRVIYISKDENVKAWAKISKKEKIPDEDSYLLLDPAVTLIHKKYNINSIPRYMLIDKQGQMINENAPHPNANTLNEELDKIIK